jgi:hypothetical protein
LYVALQTGTGGITNSPYKGAGMGFSDWKFLTFLAFSRHFAPKSAIGINMRHNDQPYFTAATGSNPVKGAFGICLPRCIEENLAALYKYNIGNVHVYPMLWYDKDYTTPPTNMFVADTSGFLKDAWNWLTNIVASNEVCDGYIYMHQLVHLNSLAVEKMQAWIPFTPFINVSRFNAAQATCYYTKSDHITQLVSVVRSVDPNTRRCLDRMILPSWYIYDVDSSLDQEYKLMEQVADYLGEDYSMATDIQEPYQYLLVEALLFQDIHVLEGNGTPNGAISEEGSWFGFFTGSKKARFRSGAKEARGKHKELMNRLASPEEKKVERKENQQMSKAMEVAKDQVLNMVKEKVMAEVLSGVAAMVL